MQKEDGDPQCRIDGSTEIRRLSPKTGASRQQTVLRHMPSPISYRREPGGASSEATDEAREHYGGPIGSWAMKCRPRSKISEAGIG
jgi:hypothetical protein